MLKKVIDVKKILVVVDMQKDFVDGSLGTAEAAEIVSNVSKKIEDFDGEIFVTYDTHFENYLSTAEGERLVREVARALEGKKYTRVEKLTFGSVELPRLIENTADGEDFSVELVGLCTDICVVSNALILKANFPERKISVDSSCCAGVTPETHKAALTTMRMCQIDVY